MRAVLLGVRGSSPAPGPEFVRYGGHTSCVALIADGADDPTLVLDAGTGLRSLTARLSSSAFQGAIAVSHLHWDHVQGLPFFAAGDRDASVVDVYLPSQPGGSARELLSRMMSPPTFPIDPRGLKGAWEFHGIEPGQHRIAEFTVHCADLAHKGGRTFGYRVEDECGSIAYLPDHAPVQGCSKEALALIDGVDVLLHDAQFLESERAIADEYGHATCDEAIALAVEAHVGRLVLFHHSPARTDDQLDHLAAQLDAPIPVIMAREGMELSIPWEFRPGGPKAGASSFEQPAMNSQ